MMRERLQPSLARFWVSCLDAAAWNGHWAEILYTALLQRLRIILKRQLRMSSGHQANGLIGKRREIREGMGEESACGRSQLKRGDVPCPASVSGIENGIEHTDIVSEVADRHVAQKNVAAFIGMPQQFHILGRSDDIRQRCMSTR